MVELFVIVICVLVLVIWLLSAFGIIHSLRLR